MSLIQLAIIKLKISFFGIQKKKIIPVSIVRGQLPLGL